MAWILLNTRRAELTRSINDLTYEKLRLQREIRKLTSFATAIADGNVTPDELSSLSSHYIGEAINLNETSFNYASDNAENMTNTYLDQFANLTQDEYYANSSLMQKANLYWDADTGELDGNQINSDLLEQYMKEYVQKYVEPDLKAYEDEYEEQKIDLETQIQTMEAERDQLDEKISSSIQKDTIKL